MTITIVEGAWRAWRVILDVPWKEHGLHVGTFETFAEALGYIGAWPER